MATICRQVPGRHLANMLHGGSTPVLPPERLRELGFALAAYPLTLLAEAVGAMREALAELAAGRCPQHSPVSFEELRTLLGFDDYDREAERYRTN
jgi:2-methylisocitrate lyase-like PEP mutase family enzyme